MPNEYDDAAATVIGGGSVTNENPYSDFAQELISGQRSQLKASALTATDIDPERHAKALSVAQKLRLPPSLVADQLDVFEKHARFEGADLDGIHRDHPKLSEWLSDRDNAAISQDDLPVLRSLDYAVRSMTAPEDDPNGILPHGFRFGGNGTIIEPIGYGQAREYRSIEDLQRELDRRGEGEGIDQAERIDRANKLRDSFGPLANFVAGAQSSAASTAGFLSLRPEQQQNAAQYAQEQTEASQQLSPGFWGDLQRGAGGLVADVPLMFAGGPIAKGAQSLLKLTRGRAVLAAAIGKTAAKYATGSAEVAAAVQPLALREGVQTGRESGGGNGLMAWAIETAIPGAFGKTGAERAIIGERLKGLGVEGWRPVAAQLAKDFGSEALEETTTELAHALHEKASGIDPHALDQDRLLKRLALAGTLGGFAGAGFNVPGAIAEKMHTDALRADRAERDALLLQQAGKAVQDSATGKRSIDRLQELVAASAGESDGKVYLQSDDWVEYWEKQGASPEGIAQSLGVDATAYQAAVEGGGSIAIPMDSYLAKIAGSEDHFKALHPKSRLSVDGMSLEEAEQWKKDAPKFLEDVQATQDEPTEVSDPVLADAVEQLITIGYAPQAAEDSAATLGFFNVLANRWNKGAEERGAKPIDPLELFDSYGLKIRREGQGPAQLDPVQEAAQEFNQSEKIPASGIMLNRVQSLLLRRQAHRENQAAKPVDKQAVTEKIVRKPQEFAQELNESGKGRDAGRRGAIRIADNRKVTISLSEKADPSTFIHEVYHFGLEVLGDLAEREGAPQDVKDDYQAVLDWMGVKSRADIKTEHHEKWARAGEKYIMEGKAPSSALRRVFARLAEWLGTVYKSLKSLGVNLTPEVRGVMDRMLASEEEIAAATREEVGSPLFLDAKTSGMSEAQFDAYAKGIEKTAMSARENLRVEILDELKREERAWWKAERERISDIVTQRVNQQKDYIAISAMTKGTLPDGTPLPDAIKAVKLDKAELVKEYGADFVKRLPRGISSKEGVTAAQAAELFGYKDGNDLVTAIANAKPRHETIRDETEAQLLQEHGDMRFDGRAETKAAEALHGDERSKVLAIELKALRDLQRKAKPIVKEAVGRAVADEKTKQEGKADERVADARLSGQIDAMKLAMRLDIQKRKAKEDKTADKAAARAVPQGIPPIELFRDVARNVIASSKVRDINPKVYLNAARKAGKEAFAAFSRKDYGLAASLKQKELLNNELFTEASKAKAEIDKTVKTMRRFLQDGTRARIGKAGEDYLEAIDELVARYSFVTLGQGKLDNRNRVAAIAKKVLEEGRPHAMAQEVIDSTQQIPYQELPYNYLLLVRDTAKAIQHLATSKNKLLKQQDQEDFDVAVGNAVASIDKNVPPKTPKAIASEQGGWDKIWSRIEGFAAAHRKLSSYARQMDGGKPGGQLWQLLVRPLNEAADAEVEARKQAAKGQRELWKPWQATGKKLNQRAVIPGVGSLNLETRIMVALNYGNEGNRARLLKDFNEAQQRAIVDSLDEADWTLVQGIWKQIDAFWPEIAAKQKRVTGLAPDKVEAAPFQTRFGEIAGGYFPIVYDPNRSPKADQQEAATVAKLYQLGDSTRATTRRGHTEERSKGLNVPLRLSLNVIPQHLSQVIHDLTHHEAIIDTNRLLNDDSLANAIHGHLGPHALREMRKIAKDIAVSDLAENGVDRFLRSVRNGVSVATLGFNLGTVAMQFTGIGQSMQLVGAWNYLRAIKSLTWDPAHTEGRFAWIRKKSSFMENRTNTSIREAAEVINQVKEGNWKDNVARWSYYLMQRTQEMVDMPTWLAGYDAAMADGKDDATAVAIADQAVKDAQGSGLTVDLAGVQRSRITQLFTVFYSYFNTTFNRSAEAVATAQRNKWSPEAIARLTTDFLLLYSFPAAMTMLVRAALKGDDDDDEDKHLLVELGKEHLGMLFGTVVGLREISGAALESYGYRGPAGAMGFDAISSLIIQAKQGELDEGLVKAGLKAIGVWKGIPTSGLTRLIDGYLYNEENRSSDPRPLLFGPPRR